MAEYQQKCSRCKKNFVLVSGKQRYVLCYECWKKSLEGAVKNAKYKKLFDIPEKFYKESMFLRNIKGYYLKFGKLSQKQISAFKKTVKKMEKS